jgi:hypothetical protein
MSYERRSLRERFVEGPISSSRFESAEARQIYEEKERRIETAALHDNNYEEHLMTVAAHPEWFDGSWVPGTGNPSYGHSIQDIQYRDWLLEPRQQSRSKQIDKILADWKARRAET